MESEGVLKNLQTSQEKISQEMRDMGAWRHVAPVKGSSYTVYVILNCRETSVRGEIV
jgi:hypothetical protein